MALFGVGDLGRALLSCRGFEERGFHVAIAFDVDAEKVGRVFAGCRCHHVGQLEEVLHEFGVRMAILASQLEMRSWRGARGRRPESRLSSGGPGEPATRETMA